jgi:hypothetical protein
MLEPKPELVQRHFRIGSKRRPGCSQEPAGGGLHAPLIAAESALILSSTYLLLPRVLTIT